MTLAIIAVLATAVAIVWYVRGDFEWFNREPAPVEAAARSGAGTDGGGTDGGGTSGGGASSGGAGGGVDGGSAQVPFTANADGPAQNGAVASPNDTVAGGPQEPAQMSADARERSVARDARASPPANAGADSSAASSVATTGGAQPAAAAGEPSVSPVAGGGYVIHIASFAARERADRLTRDMQNLGHAAFVKTKRTGGDRIWYRVYLGPFADRPAAESAASALSKAGTITYSRVLAMSST
jgi:hypothetical protein